MRRKPFYVFSALDKLCLVSEVDASEQMPSATMPRDGIAITWPATFGSHEVDTLYACWAWRSDTTTAATCCLDVRDSYQPTLQN
jgi:hypothetical protein